MNCEHKVSNLMCTRRVYKGHCEHCGSEDTHLVTLPLKKKNGVRWLTYQCKRCGGIKKMSLYHCYINPYRDDAKIYPDLDWDALNKCSQLYAELLKKMKEEELQKKKVTQERIERIQKVRREWNKEEFEKDKETFFKEVLDPYLKTEDWERIRTRRLEFNKKMYNGVCERCGERKATQVHHRGWDAYKYLGREHDFDLEALCSKCHTMIHPHMQKKGKSFQKY